MNTALKVEQSFMLSRWVMPDVDINALEQMARKFDLPEVIARLLISRDVAMDNVQSFLYPTLKEHFPDPMSLKGMEELATELAGAIKNKRKIAIFGDFDVDGATSSALLHRFFGHFNLSVPFYIPDRMGEGYGPNIAALQKLKDDGAEIIIMVDCGTTAFDIIAQGRKIGLEIIILDHHEAEDKLPDANHLINPKRKDDSSGLDMLAAVGVCFMTIVAVNTKLREIGYYKDNDACEPPMKEWLDIVALGTVCDMVPLVGVNRLLVRSGAAQSLNTKSAGLKALMDVAGVEAPITPYMSGFVLGPRINAGSRVHEADLGARLLSGQDNEEVKNIAFTLNDCNDKRKAIQMQMEAEAIKQVEDLGLDQYPVIIVAHKDWHPGLSGLVAGRLKEKYNKPAIVVTYTKNMEGTLEGRGSGRSIPGVHIANAFIDARKDGCIIKGGGHAMAGGFTLDPETLDGFKEFMHDHIAGQMKSGGVNVETQIDILITVNGVRADFIKMIDDYVGPFGQEQPEPIFAFNNVRIHNAKIVGAAHISCMISDWEGGARIKAIAFRSVDTPLGDALLKSRDVALNLAGYLKIDSWQGREYTQLQIKDGSFII